MKIRGFKLLVSMILVLTGMKVNGQWIDTWQIRPAPDSTYVIGALGDGEAAWVKFRKLDSLYGVSGGGGYVPDTLLNRGQLSLSNDTLYYKPCATCVTWFGKLPVVDESKWVQGSGRLYPKTISNKINIGNTIGSGRLNIEGMNGFGQDRAINFVSSGGWVDSYINTFNSVNNKRGIKFGGYGNGDVANDSILVLNNFNADAGLVGINISEPNTKLHIKVPYGGGTNDGLRIDNNDGGTVLQQINGEGDGVWRNTTGHYTFGKLSSLIQGINPTANIHLFSEFGSGVTDLLKLERDGGYGATVFRQYYTNGSNWGMHIGDGLSSLNSITVNNAQNRVGINKQSGINAALHIGGDLIIDNTSGTAIIGLGLDANNKVVQYTGATTPNTYITSGTDINVTGVGTMASPYVINNIKPSQVITTNGTAGNITLSNGGGTLNLNVNDADADPSNERRRLGVSSGLLVNHNLSGFTDGNGVNIQITGATKSSSASSDGGSITFTLPDVSSSNEGLMSLTTNTTNNYTYNSNTTGSTPLIIQAGTNMNFSRSGNQITFNATGVTGLTGANNGLSVNGVNAQLGNGSGLTNATLTSHRELPTGGYNVVLSGSGRFGVGMPSGGTPLALLQVGSGTSNPSTDAKILIAENVSNTSLASSHGFADGSIVTFGKSYNAFDSRWTLNSVIGGPNPHGVCFQSVPTVGVSGSVAEYYGMYAGMTNSGFVGEYNALKAIGVTGSYPNNYYGVNISNVNANSLGAGFALQSITAPNAYGLSINGINGTTTSRGISVTNITGSNSRAIYAQGITELTNTSTGDIDVLRLTRGGVNTNDDQGILFEAGSGVTKYYSGRLKSGYNAALAGNFTFEINTTGASGTGALVTGAELKTTGIFSTLSGYQVNNTATNGTFLKGNGTAYVAGFVNPSDIQQSGATINQVLAWNGSAYAPTSISTGDASSTNEGLMTLTGSSSPYTYNSNTAGSTPLIIQAGTNVTIGRSSNTLTINSSGGGGGISSVTATSPVFSTGGSNPNITIQNASTSATGALTSADWNIFNSKVGGSGTLNRVAFWNSGNTISSNSYFTYASGTLNLLTAGGPGTSDLLRIEKDGGWGATNFRSYYTNGSNYGLHIGDGYSSVNNITVNHGQNFVGINKSIPSTALHVGGALTVDSRSSGLLNNLAGFTSSGLLMDATVKTVNGNSILGTGNISIPDINIYNSDGTVTGTRTVTQNNNGIRFNHNNTGTQKYLYLGNVLGRYGIVADGTGGVIRNDDIEGEGTFMASGESLVGANATSAKIIFGPNYGDPNLSKHIDVTNNDVQAQFLTNQIRMSGSGIEIRPSGSAGSNNQVLSSNGSTVSWQNNPALDNLYNTGSAIVTFNYNTDAAIFNIGVNAQYCSNTSTTFTKSSSSAIYEIEIIANDNTFYDDLITLGLYRSGTQIATSIKGNANFGGEEDLHFKFLTDANSGPLTIRNLSGVNLNMFVKMILIKRIR